MDPAKLLKLAVLFTLSGITAYVFTLIAMQIKREIEETASSI